MPGVSYVIIRKNSLSFPASFGMGIILQGFLLKA